MTSFLIILSFMVLPSKVFATDQEKIPRELFFDQVLSFCIRERDLFRAKSKEQMSVRFKKCNFEKRKKWIEALPDKYPQADDEDIDLTCGKSWLEKCSNLNDLEKAFIGSQNKRSKNKESK